MLRHEKTNGFDQSYVKDKLFDSLKLDYTEFETWYGKQANAIDKDGHYWIKNDNTLAAFIGLKTENEVIQVGTVNQPAHKRIKITTIKSDNTFPGFSEMVIYFSIRKAMENNIDEVYFTVIPDTPEKEKLVAIAKSYGFVEIGKASSSSSGIERKNSEVYLLKKLKYDSSKTWKENYPFIWYSNSTNVSYLIINETYHDRIFQDAELWNTKQLINIADRLTIRKIIAHNMDGLYKLKQGDVALIYRRCEGSGATHKSAITGIALIDHHEKNNSKTLDEFVAKIGNRHAFASEDELKYYFENSKYLTHIIYLVPFGGGNNINHHTLKEWGMFDGYPASIRLNSDQFKKILIEVGKNAEDIIANKR